MSNRKKRIIEANFHEMYKLFLFECENEPLSREEGWKNNIPYVNWVSEMNKRFKTEKKFPLGDNILWYLNERELWVSEQLSKYISEDANKNIPPIENYVDFEKLLGEELDRYDLEGNPVGSVECTEDNIFNLYNSQFEDKTTYGAVYRYIVFKD